MMTTSISSGDNLLDFRTIWLSVIAEAWADPKFKESLLSSEHAEQLICPRFSFTWPWDGVLTLKVVEAIGFKYENSRWHYPTAPEAEGLTLFVPLTAPTNSNPNDRAKILAAYYRKRPTLLIPGQGFTESRGFNVASALRQHLLASSRPILSYTALATGRNGLVEEAPEGGFLPNNTDFANFEIALLHAMVEAWDSSEARDLLQKNPPAAIHNASEYEAPWNISLRVRNDDHAKWDANSGEWQNLTANELTLSLPETPKPVPQHGIALAKYNEIGAAYPFSCCP